MLKWPKAAAAVVLLALMLAMTMGTVLAQDTHIYGLVFIDSNGNGVWDSGEQGYPGVYREYWDDDEEMQIEEYVGAEVSFFAGNEEEIITLRTAGMTSDCTVQDYVVETDDEDDDDGLMVNPSPGRPCAGTFGLRPAGEDETVWRVTLTPPDGYVVTSQNPVSYEIGKDQGPIDFGIAPTGAGGPTGGQPVLLPETGGIAWAGVAALVAAGLGLAALRKRQD